MLWIHLYHSGLTFFKGVYGAICDLIKSIANDASPDCTSKQTLDELISGNIKTTNQYGENSNEARRLLGEFLDETRLDFEGADKQSKELDALLRAYNREVTFPVFSMYTDMSSLR